MGAAPFPGMVGDQALADTKCETSASIGTWYGYPLAAPRLAGLLRRRRYRREGDRPRQVGNEEAIVAAGLPGLLHAARADQCLLAATWLWPGRPYSAGIWRMMAARRPARRSSAR